MAKGETGGQDHSCKNRQHGRGRGSKGGWRGDKEMGIGKKLHYTTPHLHLH
jgi:hypothetical protein